MKENLENFENFYDKCMQDDELFTEWEQVKITKDKRKKVAIVIILIIDLVIIYFITRCFGIFNLIGITSFIFIVVFGIFIVDAFIFGILNIGTNSKYNSVYKEKIIDNLLKNFFNEVDYIPKKKMPEAIYREPKYEGYDEYSSDDYMDGIIDEKYPIKMADIKTVDVETDTDSDGHTTTTRTIVFSGLFAKIDIGKSIKNELKIKQNWTILKKDKLEMDSSEFEKYFDVSSSNQIIGMQLLTHDIMDLLIDYRIRLNSPFDIVIKDNIMYIRLHIGQMFEGRFNKKQFIDKNSLEEYYNMVNFIYDLSKQMIKVVNETEI